MRTVRAVTELRAALAPERRAGRTIGLVPTMGALHEGHLSLIARARSQCDVVVVSLFVNPSQFDERSDLEGYPRREAADRELAACAGADLLFAPSTEEVYPAGFATSVEVLGVTDRLEGEVRGAAHFRGVSTVVTKLLCMVGPHLAYFGQKDAQQVAVIRRLIADLNLPVRVEVCPTVRETDGLAMSSRNARLSQDERRRALSLRAALSSAAELARRGERAPAALLAVAAGAMEPFAVEPEYLAIVDPDTFESVACLDRPVLFAVAARVGATRLIDNEILRPAGQPGLRSPAQSTSDRSTAAVQQPAMRSPDPDQLDPREAQTTCSA